MNFELKGKTVVVTGAAGGIGSVVVKTLLCDGAKVAMIGNPGEKLEKAAKKMSEFGEVKAYGLNLAKAEDIEGTVAEIVKDFGSIDGLVQTAGILAADGAFDISIERWDQVMNVNTRAMFFMMREVVKQSMQNTGGAIVNIASMAGVRGMEEPLCSAHYSASKGGVVALCLQGATEWAKYGVRVNAVAPGGVRVGGMAEMTPPPQVTDPVPLKRLSEPEEVADTICFLLSKGAGMITGQTIMVDGGASIVGH
ncbi:MAG: SDR family oxidoreductase [Eubacterium sp.]|nr:SDR family oxidoreductase [Eubacterium sp.]